MKPHQIISLMTFEGADNTLSLPDHADHIHVGFRPLYGTNSKLGRQLNAVLKPSSGSSSSTASARSTTPTCSPRLRSTRSTVKRVERANVTSDGRARRERAAASPSSRSSSRWVLGPGRRAVRRRADTPASPRTSWCSTRSAHPSAAGCWRRRRRATPAAPEPEPTPVTTTRVTLVAAEPFGDAAQARALADRRRRRRRGRSGDRPSSTASCTPTASASADPYVREVAREQALVVRIGIGRGRAGRRRTLDRGASRSPPPAGRERRERRLRPQERLAAILAGRDVALACEELALRARAGPRRGPLARGRAAAARRPGGRAGRACAVGRPDRQPAERAARGARERRDRGQRRA